MGRFRLAAVAALVLVALVLPLSTALAAPPFASAAFQSTWARTDGPVASGAVSRTWMWGPQPDTPPMTESYVEAPGGKRTVQYFDKTRMEDNSYRASSPWDVTNGLLAEELITGRMQLGDNTFHQYSPAQVNVAGDLNDPNGPTYASFSGLMGAAPLANGAVVTQTVDRAGRVGSDSSLASDNVTATDVGASTGHTVASVFWAFMTSTGPIAVDGQTTTGPLFPNAFYATGYPLTEPYWATVLVGGVQQQVLVQVFERRVLTYTPSNPTGWQVESGNVGLQYYQWRYQQGSVTPTPSPSPSPTPAGPTGRIVFAHADGVQLLGGQTVIGPANLYVANVATPGAPPVVLNHQLEGVPSGPTPDSTQPAWSPDGTRVAFSERTWVPLRHTYAVGPSGIYIVDVNAPSTPPVRLNNIVTPMDQPQSYSPGNGFDCYQPAWSPDGTHIAFVVRPWTVAPDNTITFGTTEIMIADVTQPLAPPVRLNNLLTGDNTSPAWSPDGTRIAFVHGGVIEVARVDQPGAPPVALNSQVPSGNLDPAWSPDGTRIAFVHAGTQTYTWQAAYSILVATVDQPSTAPVPLNNLVSNAAFTPSWSPDGQYIAFTQAFDTVHSVFGIDIVQVGQPLAPPTILNTQLSGLNFDQAWTRAAP